MSRLLLLAVASSVVLTSLAAAQSPPDVDDYLMHCSSNDARCQDGRQMFLRWYPLAWKGDYQGQRNVAFAFKTGSDGAVLQQPLLACAWRLVIIQSGSLQVDESDTLNARVDCGKLDPIGIQAATAQSVTLSEMLSKVRRRK